MKIVVCVPTLNARSEWPAFCSALKSQTAAVQEVIILDSESDDGTGEFAVAAGFRLHTIPRKEFSHGGTRQMGARLAGDCDVLVYLTQDAILASEDALAKLVQAFDDPKVGAAYGCQLPRKGAGPIEAHARKFNYPPESYIRSMADAGRFGFKTIFFSNSFGAYRRSALFDVGGFPQQTNFGEDTQVAAKLLQSGWHLAYVSSAQAYHSHPYTLLQEFRRYVEIGRMHATEPWLVREFGGTSGEGLKFMRSESVYLAARAPHRIPGGILRSALKYLGYQIGKRQNR